MMRYEERGSVSSPYDREDLSSASAHRVQSSTLYPWLHIINCINDSADLSLNLEMMWLVITLSSSSNSYRIGSLRYVHSDTTHTPFNPFFSLV
jgi:hypothetical protein